MTRRLAHATFVVACAAGAASLAAQSAQDRSRSRPRTYAIRNAKVVTLAAAPIERGTLVFTDGKIVDVGPDVAVPSGAEVIDGTGLEVYPGFFDAASQLGLTEIGSVSGTNDLTELGDFNPQLVAAIAVHPASEHLPVARTAGITHAVVVPGLNAATVIGGQASAIHLAGWTIEDMLVERSVGLAVTWPTLRTRSFDAGTLSVRERPFNEIKKEYDEKVRQLDQWLDEARHYGQALAKAGSGRVERDLKLEALVAVVDGKRPLLITADEDRDIKRAVEFCERQKVRMVLLGGAGAWKVKDLLASKKIPVILGPVQALPSSDDEPYDVRNTTPGVLQQAGVKFALASFSSPNARNLPYEIGNAVPFGLSHDDALKAITRSPAEILGLADRLGTLERGKLANLIVTDGDPLEIRTNVKYLFINGEPTSLDNRHRRLYEQYRARPRKSSAESGARNPE